MLMLFTRSTIWGTPELGKSMGRGSMKKLEELNYTTFFFEVPWLITIALKV
ncbi:MAG: hypothetical protein PWQ20_1503 [Thermotogaceae bacterium]|jgi:hypothetical protein|nr:hypothetical protein [Thermotogaceae bacterium]